MSDLGNIRVMAQNIQHYLDINGKDRNDLVRDLGFKYTTICNWLQGKSYPRIDKIEMMANYFGISKSDLVERPSDSDDSKFNETELALVRDYRRLNDLDQQAIRFIMDRFQGKVFDKPSPPKITHTSTN